jgi:aspartate/tyrosine/aromatic aminotransferase
MHIPVRTEDPIYGLQVEIKKDKRKNLLNLSIGTLVDERGELFQFSAVRRAEKKVLQQSARKEYLPIDGLPSFCSQIQELVLGEKIAAYTAQTVGGTAALHIAGQFIARFCSKEIFIPDPTWVNHRPSLEAAGLTVCTYPYLISKTGHLNIEAIAEALLSMPKGAAVLLQASCHNPTGIDPNDRQWRKIAQVVAQRKLVVLFDMAYQGLGNGLREDAQAISLFRKAGLEFFVASSCSKNFGLYGERLGALTVVCKEESLGPIASQIRYIIRSNYSSPPRHGAEIANMVLQDKKLRQEWEEELALLRKRLRRLRSEIGQEQSRGLFCLSGIAKKTIKQLKDREAIYLSDDGRINIAALSSRDISRIRDLLS